MPRVFIGLTFAMFALVSGLGAQASFNAERSSEPPHTERPTRGRIQGIAPRVVDPEATEVLVYYAAVEHAAHLETERIERERIEQERLAAEEAARLEAERAARQSVAPRPTSLGGPSSSDPLARIRQCESGGNYGAVSAGGRYRGAYQFDQRTWEGVGGTGDPAAADPAEQDYRAQILYDKRGGAPWPVCSG